MSRQLINAYRAELDHLKAVSGSKRESVLREAFKDLLKRWGKSNDLLFIPEHNLITPKGNRIYVDGALLHGLRVPFGYWEAKDEADDLEKEIEAKFRKGYPRDNIIFEDTVTAVLYQDGHEVARAAMDDTETLLVLLTRFFAHERQEVADFRKAVKQFALDLPAVLEALRSIIADKRKASPKFARAEAAFLAHARSAINPMVTEGDVQEMLIQHILTEDIFAKVFENPDFHRQNNVAVALIELEKTLFDYGEKQRLLKGLGPYYAGIQSTAALIESHSEKQGFLKGLYENFYKVYNPMAADRLGVVYTPGEIVRFMIRSADWLCETHFGKNLIDSGVEILDPATGTGTFIVELMEHFRGDHAKLRHKYKEELHANEVAILPYYVANLNIEATYAAITGQFAEYPNLCFVDTLDNVAALGIYAGHQGDMFGSVSDENMGRIKRQNDRRISVIIGNPPYNANQQNENDNNKNRVYQRIDERIKATYIKASTAQKTKLYDMYARFYRWASDRLTEDGVLAFITNRSFIESRTFDGFRKAVATEFNEIYVIDLGGDVRANPKLSGTKHNVFGIQTGVAICYLVRRKGLEGCTIRYVRRPEDETAEDKLSWLGGTELKALAMTVVKPNVREDWLHTESASGWDAMLPIASRQTKQTSIKSMQSAIFSNFSFGLVTNRDDWVYDRSKQRLVEKTISLVSVYEAERKRLAKLTPVKRAKELNGSEIKWTRSVKRSLAIGREAKHDPGAIIRATYRPFDKQWLMFDRHWIEMPNLTESFFGKGGAGRSVSVVFTDPTSQKPFMTLAIDGCADMHIVGAAAGGVIVPKIVGSCENITDWAVAQFAKYYGATEAITKDAIFAYCYAALHDPLYRTKYALNLKREFPRIPFYPDFAKWVAWGEELLKLHIDYENVKPAKITRVDTPAPKRAAGALPKPKLKSIRETGTVVVDEDTQLSGIPVAAWDYRLGNRSAIDWVLDQHKERTPRDPTIRAKFNTYRFSDYKENMIALIGKVVRVSADTVAITEAMRNRHLSQIP